MQTKEVIILAGGLGTRLKGVIADIPKPMAPVAGNPFLKYIFDYLVNHKISCVVLAVGYKYENIYNYFGEDYKGLELKYSVEEEPLGTGGAIRLAVEKIENEELFIINGDTFFDVNLLEFEQFAKVSKSDLALALKPMQLFDRYGSVEIKGDKILSFKEKQFVEAGLINGGVYYCGKSLFSKFTVNQKFSFEKDLMEKYVNEKNLTGYTSDTYFIDIGIPEDYAKANVDFITSKK